MALRTVTAPLPRYDDGMRWSSGLHALLLATALAVNAGAGARPQTVCTITVNSPEEKQSFARHLPADRARFVELVERGRPDWLATACQASIACDVLVISGHYDGDNEFFSDRLDVNEHLPVSELERASCSDTCPALFSRLKEVYLFGCNTLNPQPQSSASADIVRSLVREGHSPAAAARQLQTLNAELGESSRERMRQVFKDVPVIYGFSSLAPLGPIAGATLDRFFRAGGAADVGRGRRSSRLLEAFAPYGLSVAAGLTDQDPQADVRRDVCRLVDERRPAADKLGFVHELLQRPMVQTRLHLDRIQRFTATLDEPDRQPPALADARERIDRDGAARARYLDFARQAALPEARVRMLQLAQDLGWLSSEQRWTELALMLSELQSFGTVGVPEVNLACSLNRQLELEGAFNRRVAPGSPADSVAHAALRACLGSAEGRARTLQGLLGHDAADVAIAQAYLRHQPITDAAELRRVAEGITRMPPSEAQVRALETLGRHYVSDPGILQLLTELYVQTPSAPVQAAIAGLLLRADRRAMAGPALLHTLQAQRRPTTDGENMIDALIERLQTP
jgi:hypothetical protein